jgi:hypothetical protein
MSYDNLSSVSQNVLKFISSLPVKRGGSLSFLVRTISNVLVMEIGWTDVGRGGYILVSCAHSNTSFLCPCDEESGAILIYPCFIYFLFFCELQNTLYLSHLFLQSYCVCCLQREVHILLYMYIHIS